MGHEPSPQPTWPLLFVIVGMAILGMLWIYAGVLFGSRSRRAQAPTAIVAPNASPPIDGVRTADE